jgi:hypothetical protein
VSEFSDEQMQAAHERVAALLGNSNGSRKEAAVAPGVDRGNATLDPLTDAYTYAHK